MISQTPDRLVKTGQPTYDSCIRVFNRTHTGPVTVEAVKNHITSLKRRGYRPATIASAKAALKKSVRLTFKNHDVRFNALLDAAFKEIRVPKPDVKVYSEELITESDAKQLISRLPDKLALIVETLLATGLRISELLNVRRSDCRKEKQGDTTYIFVRVIGKGSKERRVVLTQELFERIISTFKGNDFLFVNRSGRKLSRFYVARAVREYGMRILGKHIHPHSFRHSFANTWIQKKDAHAVASYLGHASPATTLEMYVHTTISPEELFA